MRFHYKLELLQLNMMLDLATEAWKWGELSTHLAMKQAQLKEESFTLDSVQGNVKLTKNVVLNSFETWQVFCIIRCNVHRMRVHVVAEPPKSRLDGLQQEVYTVPTYSELNLVPREST